MSRGPRSFKQPLSQEAFGLLDDLVLLLPALSVYETHAHVLRREGRWEESQTVLAEANRTRRTISSLSARVAEELG